MDEVVEAMIASGRKCSHARRNASRFASSVSVTPSNSTSASASAAGASACATTRMRFRIAACCASFSSPRPASSVRFAAISDSTASRSSRAPGLKSMMSTW